MRYMAVRWIGDEPANMSLSELSAKLAEIGRRPLANFTAGRGVASVELAYYMLENELKVRRILAL